MNKTWLILIVPLVLGCISGGGDEDTTLVGQCFPELTTGLEINNFYPDLYDVYAGEGDITLTLEVENIGSSEATRVEAELFNLGGFIPDKTIARISDIEVPEEGMPPVTDEATWDMTAPEFGTATAKDISVGGVLYYDYTSRGQASAVFVPTEEWRKMRETGATSVDVEQDCSNGPVVVSVEPLRQPVTDTREFTTRIVVANIGSGKVKSETNGLDTVDRVTVQLPAYLEVGSVCDLTGSGAGALLTADNIKLVKGNQKVLTCKLAMTAGAPTVRQAKYKIDATADYRYSVERSAAFRVTEEVHTLTIGATDTDANQEWTADGADTYTFELDPKYDGDSIAPLAAAWTWSIKNDVTVADTSITCTPTGSDPVAVSCTAPALLDSKYKDADNLVTLTVKLEHEGKHATALIDGIEIQ